MHLVLLYNRLPADRHVLPLLLTHLTQTQRTKLANALHGSYCAAYTYRFGVVNGVSTVGTIKQMYSKRFLIPTPRIYCISSNEMIHRDARKFTDAFAETNTQGGYTVHEWLRTLPDDWPIYFAEDMGSGTGHAVHSALTKPEEIYHYDFHYEHRKYNESKPSNKA